MRNSYINVFDRLRCANPSYAISDLIIAMPRHHHVSFCDLDCGLPIITAIAGVKATVSAIKSLQEHPLEVTAKINLERFCAVSAISIIVKNCTPLLL